ncbi:hypothetical protein [Cystobacter fuscus]|uniref:hypothetical protein n=1 Tax=Cystobacter fuscus TaxID=43 RepID=UPI0012FD5223|nr:hypothetical protein [Cystobacter fuscus]
MNGTPSEASALFWAFRTGSRNVMRGLVLPTTRTSRVGERVMNPEESTPSARMDMVLPEEPGGGV